jgi:hypothetical protein
MPSDTPTTAARENLEWLVWFARKSRGTVAEVVDRAVEQNPWLRDPGAEAVRSFAGLDVERIIADTLGNFDTGTYRGPVEVVPYKGESSDDYLGHRYRVAEIIAAAIAVACSALPDTASDTQP